MMSLGNTRNLTFRIISIIVTRFDYRVFIYILVLIHSFSRSISGPLPLHLQTFLQEDVGSWLSCRYVHGPVSLY
jgi:hypothetical protein